MFLVPCALLISWAESSQDSAIAVLNPQRPAAAAGLVPGNLEGQDEGDDDDDETTGAALNSGAQPCNSETSWND